MDIWQREYIRKNMTSLLELTDCNVLLITILHAAGVLSEPDVDVLNTIHNSKGRLSQTLRLYEILQTKLNGYEMITNAVYQCKQSGALKLLLEGFRQQKITNPLERCCITKNIISMLDIKVMFLGQEYIMKEILNEDSVICIKNILQPNNFDLDYIDYVLLNNKQLVLAKDTIPNPPTFYIQRSITTRNKLHPEIFKQNCSDIFVFKGIDRVRLSNLAHPQTTSTSTTQLLGFTSRFILLEENQDWLDLRNAAKEAIHLIRFESGRTNKNILSQADRPNVYIASDDYYDQNFPGSTTASLYSAYSDRYSLKSNDDDTTDVYFVEDTKGQSKYLGMFVNLDNNQVKSVISEGELVEMLNNPGTANEICICDSPGMGKSWLLQSLARQVRTRYPENIILFTTFQDFIVGLKQDLKRVELTPTTALDIVLSHLTSSSFSKTILMNSVKRGHKHLEIFFDALEEISYGDLNMVINFLKILKSFEVKLYITSRPHLHKELENLLGLIAYDIVPFTETDKVNFLVKTWMQDRTSFKESKLTEYALECLKNVKAILNFGKIDIMGIPLQCSLLADVYSTDAKRFAMANRKQKIPLFKFESLYEIFKCFVEPRLSMKGLNNENSEALRMFHTQMAIRELFPEISINLKTYGVVNKLSDESCLLLSKGILESRSKDGDITPKFVHRVFAEFLVAEYIADIMECKLIGSETIIDPTSFLVALNVFKCGYNQNIFFELFNSEDSTRRFFPLLTFNYPVIGYFLNTRLSSRPLKSLNFLICKRLFSWINPQQVYILMQCSISHNFVSLFCFLGDVIKTLAIPGCKSFLTSKKIRVINEASDFGDLERPSVLLSLMATKFCDVVMLQEFFSLFTHQFCLKFSKRFHKQYEKTDSMLFWPVKRGNYELVEYLIDKISYNYIDILNICIKDSYNENTETATSKEYIVKLLTSKCKTSPIKSTNFYKDMLENSTKIVKVHVDILKYLLVEGPPTVQMWSSEPYFKKTIVHISASYMSPTDLHELYRFLIEDLDAKALFRQNRKWLSPLHFILNTSNILLATLKMILDVTIVNVNIVETEYYRNNLLLSAICGMQSVEVIKYLITSGVNYKYKNHEGKNVLHLAARYGHHEAISLFLILGVSLNERDRFGYTPLLSVKSNDIKTIEYLLKLGVNLCATDSLGNTIAHKIAGDTENSNKNFHNLVKCLSKRLSSSILLIKNHCGQTPLHIRFSHGKTFLSTAKLYLDIVNIDINAKDNEGNNLFLSAASGCEDTDILEMSIELGADVYARNSNGQNALHLTLKNICNVTRKTFYVIKFLLNLNIDSTQMDQDGQTPLDYAIRLLENFKHNTYNQLVKCQNIKDVILLLRGNTQESYHALQDFLAIIDEDLLQ